MAILANSKETGFISSGVGKPSAVIVIPPNPNGIFKESSAMGRGRSAEPIEVRSAGGTFIMSVLANIYYSSV